MRSPGVNETNLNGPVPIAARPVLKSSSAAFSNRAGWIEIRLRLLGSSGNGPSVSKRMVCASTTVTVLIGRTNGRNELGLLRMVEMRRIDAATSSAVKGVPS